MIIELLVKVKMKSKTEILKKIAEYKNEYKSANEYNKRIIVQKVDLLQWTLNEYSDHSWTFYC